MSHLCLAQERKRVRSKPASWEKPLWVVNVWAQWSEHGTWEIYVFITKFIFAMGHGFYCWILEIAQSLMFWFGLYVNYMGTKYHTLIRFRHGNAPIQAILCPETSCQTMRIPWVEVGYRNLELRNLITIPRFIRAGHLRSWYRKHGLNTVNWPT